MIGVLDQPDVQLRHLMEVHGRVVRAALGRSVRDRATVDDLWAEVFTVAFRRLSDLVGLPEGQQRAWLIRTAGHLAANQRRRGGTRRRTLERLLREPIVAVSGPEDELFEASARVESDVTSRVLREVLASLREQDREVLVLDALGHNGPSIARQLGISHGAARKRLMQARRALRVAFAAYGDGAAVGREVS